MRIAAVPYACRRRSGWVEHEADMLALLGPVEADLIVLPEYAAMDAALMSDPPTGTAMEWRDRAAHHAPDWVAQWQMLAARLGAYVLAGSGPCRTEAGVVNRCWLIAPSGAVTHQDKLILTPYERDTLGMIGGTGLTLADTALGRIAILICYDAEFPLLARCMAEEGAEIILIPSCTDLPAGQTRVRQSARARALENQIVTVQAPLTGAVPGCDIIDVSTGRAGIFAPPDHGLPPDGILAQGGTDDPAPVTWDGDPRAIIAARDAAQVSNFAHWPEQSAHRGPPRIVTLT